MNEKCNHESAVPVKAIANTHLCLKCGEALCVHEIEVLGMFYEVGGFCDNEKCDRYLILVI